MPTGSNLAETFGEPAGNLPATRRVNWHRRGNGVVHAWHARQATTRGRDSPVLRSDMDPISSESSESPGAETLSADDLNALRRAKHELESPALAMKLAGIVGSPIEKLLSKIPAAANEKVNDATQ